VRCYKFLYFPPIGDLFYVSQHPQIVTCKNWAGPDMFREPIHSDSATVQGLGNLKKTLISPSVPISPHSGDLIYFNLIDTAILVQNIGIDMDLYHFRKDKVARTTFFSQRFYLKNPAFKLDRGFRNPKGFYQIALQHGKPCIYKLVYPLCIFPTGQGYLLYHGINHHIYDHLVYVQHIFQSMLGGIVPNPSGGREDQNWGIGTKYIKKAER